MEDSLRALEIAPRKNQLEKELTWSDTPLVEVPDLIGLTKKELRQQLINFKLDIDGEGETVVKQLPSPGVKIKEGSVIRVYMND